MEYGIILNYPRMLDQIKNIDQNQDEEFTSNIERLGKDSLRHSNVVASLIENLGGKPDYDTVVVDRMIDIHSMLVEQLGKERLMESLYKEARLIAQTDQAKEKALFGKLMSIRGEPKQYVSRSEVIVKLTRLELDEMSHAKRIESMLIQMNLKAKKKDS